MKKFLVMMLVMLMFAVSAYAQTDKEILFRDTPWGISFTEAQKIFPEYDLSSWLAGAYMRIYPIEEIITDNSETDFEYSDINIPGSCEKPVHKVAGYMTSDIDLYFAYVPVDGVLTHKEKDSAMYAARYEFKPADIEVVATDLTSKLQGLYGEHDYDYSFNGLFEDYEIYGWFGAKDTSVAITIKRAHSDSSYSTNMIYITYFNMHGNDWLQTASDAEKAYYVAKDVEASYSGDTSGL